MNGTATAFPSPSGRRCPAGADEGPAREPHCPHRPHPLPEGEGIKRVSLKSEGFTLIELLVTVVIVGILAAIAYPNYRNYVLRTNRVAAKSAMTDLVSRQESYFADRKGYATSLTALGYAAATVYLTSDGGMSASESSNTIYSLTLNPTSATCPATGSGTGGTTGYTVVATPRKTQVQDAQCGSLCLTASGIKSVSGTSTDCWKR